MDNHLFVGECLKHSAGHATTEGVHHVPAHPRMREPPCSKACCVHEASKQHTMHPTGPIQKAATSAQYLHVHKLCWMHVH